MNPQIPGLTVDYNGSTPLQPGQTIQFGSGTPLPIYSGGNVLGTTATGNNPGSLGNPTGNATPTAPTGPSESDLINTEYNNRINDLNSQSDVANRNYGSIQGDINSQAAGTANTLNSNFNQSNAGLDLTTQQGGQRHQDALSAARRLYNDLMMGGQQRFGGASSAGEAYGALTGRQLQQNNQSIDSQFNDFNNQIGLARTNIKAKYDDAIAQNEQQKNLALNQAYRDFQDQISQLNSLKNQAGSDKAAQQLAALQNLRNQIYNINIATAQNSQAVNNLRTQAEANLQDAMTKFGQSTAGAQTAQTAFNTNTQAPTNNLAFGGTPHASQSPYQAGQIAAPQRQDQNFWDQSLA